MRTILKGSGALVAMLLLAASTASYAYNRVEKPLYAGRHILIGKLIVEQYKVNTKKYLRVTYDTTGSDWGMTATHLYVSKNKPTRAAPGRFPFKHEGLDNVKIDVFEIPLSTLLCSDAYLYIAAHADVCEFVTDPSVCTPDFNALNERIGTLNQVMFGFGLTEAYFKVDLGSFGIFPGYCLDFSGRFPSIPNNGLPAEQRRSVLYDAIFHSSYLGDGSINTAAQDLLGTKGRIDQNLDLVNYLLNQSYSLGAGLDPNVLPSATQLAIWYLVNGITPASLLPSTGYETTIALAAQMIADAEANGEGFVPACGQFVVVVIDTTAPSQDQHIGFVTTVQGVPTVGDCETAWAKGTTRFRTGWGSYFKYTVK